MQRILVIGGNGFLGRYLVAKLLDNGYAVRIFSRRETLDWAARGGEFFRGDVCDFAALNAAMKNVAAVFHTAAKVGVSGHYADYERVNVIGTNNVIAAACANGVEKLIYTSTPSVVFGTEEIIGGDETLPYPAHFLTAYAASKALAEQAVLAANGEKILTCALRPHLIWGAGDTHLIPRLLQKAHAKKLWQIGAGKNLISVSYVENTADAHEAALRALQKKSPVAGSVYFINESEPVNCWEFIGKILATFGAPPITRKLSLSAAYKIGAVLEGVGKIFAPAWEPPMTRFLALQLAKSHWFRIEKAQRELNWQPRISLAEGLRKMANNMPQGK